jgi:Ca2+-transporting ATPase
LFKPPTADITKKEDITYVIPGKSDRMFAAVCADKNNINYLHYRKHVRRSRLADYKFYFGEKKMMSTAYEKEKGFRLFTKVSPEKVLYICNRILYTGTIIPMTPGTTKISLKISIKKLR